jgi:hypothetical protein
MADAKLEITGDTQHAQRENDKLTKQVAKLREEVRRLGDQSKKSGKESQDSFSGMAAGLSKTISGLVTIEAGAQAVAAVYNRWRQDVERLGEAHKKLTADVVKTASATGMLGRGADLEKFLGSLRGATRAQGSQAFLGVAGAGQDMDFARKTAIAQLVAQQAPTGVNLQEVGAMAGDFGELFSGKSAGDITDLTMKSRALAGDKAGQLGSDAFMRAIRGMTAAGMSPEESMGRAIGALDSDQQLKQFTALGAALTAEKGTFGQNRKDSAEEKRFDAASPEERMRLLQSDSTLARKVLGTSAGFSLQQQDQDDLDRRTKALRDAQSGDFAQQQVDSLQDFGFGRQALREHQAAVDAERVTAPIGEAKAVRDVAFQEARTRISGNPLGHAVGESFLHDAQSLSDPIRQGTGFGADVGAWLAKLVGLAQESNRLTTSRPNIDAHTE